MSLIGRWLPGTKPVSRWLDGWKSKSRSGARRPPMQRPRRYELLERREVMAGSVLSSLVIRVPGDGVPNNGSDVSAIVEGKGVDSQSNVYLSGFTANAIDGSIIDFDPNHSYGDNRDLHTVGISALGFLAKYDSNGFLQWKFVSDQSFPKAIAIGQISDQVYAGLVNRTGDVNSIGKFDAVSGSLLWQTQVESRSRFVVDEQSSGVSRIFQVSSQQVSGYGFAKINAYDVSASGLSGPSWSAAQTYTSGGSAGWGSGASDIAVSSDHGSIYVSGEFKGNVDFDPSSTKTYRLSTGSTDINYKPAAFVWKLNASSGGLIWADAFTIGKTNSYSTAGTVKVDPAGNIVVGGQFYGTVDLDPGKGSFIPTSAGASDIYLAKLNPSGGFVYGRRYGNSAGNAFLDLALDSVGDIYVHYKNGLVGTGVNRFVQKVSNSGAAVSNHDYRIERISPAASAEGIIVDAPNHIHIVGSFTTALHVDNSTVPTYTSDEQTIFWFTAMLSPAAPLLAASDPGSLSSSANSTALGRVQLQPILEEATRRWQRAGVDTTALAGMNMRITNLGGTTLGLATGNTFWIDDNAAGWGWFVDATPGDDREFALSGNQGEQNRMDLLTVVMHELGHLIGHEHDKAGVMAETLIAGVRRTGLEHDDVAPADHVFGQSNDHGADTWLGAWLNEQFDASHGRAKRRR